MTLAPRTLLQMVRDNAAAGDEAMLFFVGIGADGGLIEETRSYQALIENGEHLAGALNAAGARSSFVEIQSDKGHDAFLLDEPVMDGALRGFLDSVRSRW